MAELSDIRKALDRFTTALKEHRPARGPAPDTRQAVDLILHHLDRHGEYLWGHDIALPAQVGGGRRMVERTNNLLDGFFHTVKHAERRRSGRKILTRDMETLPAAAMLTFNLTREDYVGTLCGSLDRLPQTLAELDQQRRRDTLTGKSTDHQRRPSLAELASTSLPGPDRKLVRSEAMTNRVLNAGVRGRTRVLATAN